MKNLLFFIFTILICTATALAQQQQIRNMDIDSRSPEGSRLTAAGVTDEIPEKIEILEGFLLDFPESELVGYALLGLQNLYTQEQNWAKASETGKRLVALAPDDVEVRHNHNQALLNNQSWGDLLLSLVATHEPAKRAIEPDPDEDEEAADTSAIEYFQGVLQYAEWAMSVGAGQTTDPALKAQYYTALRDYFPDGQYSANISSKIVLAYQQAGDTAGMSAELERELVRNPDSEQNLYLYADFAATQKDVETAKVHGEQLINLMTEKPAPEGVSEEEWAATKAKFTTLAIFSMGKAYFLQGSSKDSYRNARRYLLQTVDSIKAEGGEQYGLLAYMLGVCYVKLDIAGDNIRQATFWMNEAAGFPNAMQAQAQQVLTAIQAAQ